MLYMSEGCQEAEKSRNRAEGCDVLKLSIIQKLALHPNGVEFCHKFIGCILSCLATLFDVIWRCVILYQTHISEACQKLISTSHVLP